MRKADPMNVLGDIIYKFAVLTEDTKPRTSHVPLVHDLKLTTEKPDNSSPFSLDGKVARA